MLTTKARVAIHQVDEYVWCDAHGEIHNRTPNPYDEPADVEPAKDCNAMNWRPVFTTDSLLGVL